MQQNFANNGQRKVALFGLGALNSVAHKAAAQLVAELIVTLEDHVLMGGYGSAVLELLSGQAITTPVVRIGWPDQFIEHASTPEELRAKYGLSAENTVVKVKAHFGDTTSPAKLVGGA